jgi:hypothetical protein
MRKTTLQQRLIHHHVKCATDIGRMDRTEPRTSAGMFVLNLLCVGCIFGLAVIFWVATP